MWWEGGGYCLSFCQITLVFQPPLLIIIAQSLRAKCWLRGVVSGQYNDPKRASMVITLKPLELSVLERKSSVVGGFLRKDSTTYNYVMLLHIHHVAIQMISSKESRLVRRSRAVS